MNNYDKSVALDVLKGVVTIFVLPGLLVVAGVVWILDRLTD